ncbi:MAG: PAS domain-containing protein [Alphaproteobacteria bacterium]|nr:PAS domain-containing protein [Alphaproteobacteria bacterium]
MAHGSRTEFWEAGVLSIARRLRVRLRAAIRGTIGATAANEGVLDLDHVLGSIADGVYVLDRSWRVRYANDAALAALRRPGAEVLGATLWEVFPDLRASPFASQLEAAAAAGLPADFAAFLPSLNAWHETRVYPFEGGLTVYFRDVTLEREATERSRQARKLESLGQLTGGIAHDVNNLLTVMLGNFEMIALGAEERGPAGAGDLDLAEAGLRAGESASQLMHRLLAFSRRQPLAPQVVDIAALLASLEPLLRRTMGETVALEIAVARGLWRAVVDPAELETAMLNLAINARDAMPAGGHLRIEASNVTVDRVYGALAGLEQTGAFIMLAVADGGAGMSQEVLERAFEPFFTTKEPGRGTGLGLSMVYGFAKQSGGHATIDSEEGEGTVVRLYLPRTREAEIPAAAGEPRAAHGGSETILLVEDNDLVRVHTEAMLRGLGYAVRSAADGTDALLLLQEGMRPDLLLADVVLPGGMTGREVADAAAQLIPGLKVLFTSGYSGRALLEGGRVRPGVALIGKPFRRSELAARVRAQLAAPPWQPRSASVPLGGDDDR